MMDIHAATRGSLNLLRNLVTVLLAASVCLAGGALRAEFEDKLVSARALGMGGAFVAVADDASAVYWNPGALPQIKNMKVTTMHTELFGMNELKHDYLAGAVPVPYLKATVGGSWSRFGGRHYREEEYTLAAAKEMGTGHMMGLALRQLESRISSTPTMEGFAIDAGLLIKAGPHLRLGLMARNLNKPVVSEEIPQVSKLGVALQAFPRLTLAADAVQESGQDVEWHLGEEYLVSKHFALRAGYSTNPKRFSAGFGFNLLGWQVDYAYMTHDVLPATHRVSLTFDFWKSRGPVAPEDTGDAEPPSPPGGEPEIEADASRIHIGSLDNQRREKIDLNNCYPEDLVTLPGVGPAIANNIILYRELNGDYRTIEEIIQVPKVGEKLFERIKDLITVGKEGEGE